VEEGGCEHWLEMVVSRRCGLDGMGRERVRDGREGREWTYLPLKCEKWRKPDTTNHACKRGNGWLKPAGNL